MKKAVALVLLLLMTITPLLVCSADESITLQSLALTVAEQEIEVGEETTVILTSDPENFDLSQVDVSVNNKAATLTEKEAKDKSIEYTFTASKKGKYTVTAKSGKKKTTLTINVIGVQARGIAVDYSEIALNVGDSYAITATVSPDIVENKKITWKTGNKKIATVSGGKITAKGEGTTQITAQTANGLTATVTVIVSAKVTDKTVIKAVQEQLNKAGYDCGNPNGSIGKQTSSAVMAYRSEKGMTPGTAINNDLLTEMELLKNEDLYTYLGKDYSEFGEDYSLVEYYLQYQIFGLVKQSIFGQAYFFLNAEFYDTSEYGTSVTVSDCYYVVGIGEGFGFKDFWNGMTLEEVEALIEKEGMIINSRASTDDGQVALYFEQKDDSLNVTLNYHLEFEKYIMTEFYVREITEDTSGGEQD